MSSIDSKTSILVTGAQGQLGQRLLERASTKGDLKAMGVDRDEMDICDLVQIERTLDQVSPDVVINAAAYTAVDLAETHVEQAHLVNAVGVGNLAAACASRGISMIHMSTDYVFDGNLRHPLNVEDPVGPLSVYGESKLRGEEAFTSSGVKGAVIRVAWLYDATGQNFVSTMLKLADQHGSLKVVDDQHGVPTSAVLLAEGLLDMATWKDQMPSGIWHYAHGGHTTWHGFAQEIMRLAERDVPVLPVDSKAFPTAAKRPSWSVLNGLPLHERMQWNQVTWQEALQRTWRLKSDG